MRFTVIGGGALGLLFTARLQAAGCSVELVVRSSEQEALLRREGLTLREGSGQDGGEVRCRPVIRSWEAWSAEERGSGGATEEPCGENRDEAHFVLLAVKQSAIDARLAEALGRRLQGQAWLVCLQNGIGHVELLARAVEPQRMLLAVTTEGALKRSLTEAAHTGRGVTWIGPAGSAGVPGSELDEDRSAGMGASAGAGAGGHAEAVQKKLAEGLARAGFESRVSKNIQQRVWQKLLINAVINPLTALLEVTNGELPRLPEAGALMDSLLEEGTALAAGLGIPLEAELRAQLYRVCEATSANASSMLQDLRSGRSTEIDSISGGLLREAQRLGIRLPCHETVYRLIKAKEERGRRPRQL